MLKHALKHKIENNSFLGCLRIYLTTFISFIFLIPVSTQAENDYQKTIYWYYDDFPPNFIVSEPYLGKGSGDQLIKTFIQHMPQFHHKRVLAPHNRALVMANSQLQGCYAELLKTPERAAKLEFSAPLLHILSNGFIILRTRLIEFKAFFNQSNQLKLDDFLKNGTYRVGIVSNRSFGKNIDNILKKYPKSVATVSSYDGLSSRLLKLINQHEYDAVISYPDELQYVIHKLNLNPQDFIFIPIAENYSLQPIYTACAKSAFGKEIIININSIISKPVIKHEIETAYRFWLDSALAARWDRLHTDNTKNQ